MKTLDELALFGGEPLFAEKIYVGRPNIGDRAGFLKELNQVLDDRWLTNDGRCVRTLESRLADYLGVKHCVAMCNATVALEITARALELKGEVIVPSLTFIATAHALQWQMIKPVFCDIDPATHNLDPGQIAQLITPNTTGIVGVHLWGRPAPVDELIEIAAARKLRLMFDAAHAFGCSYKGRMIGGFGDAEIFSFHATKFFNTFEGGAVTTNNDALAGKLRLMRNFGFAGFDNVIYIGTNGKMSEVSGAMGLASLVHLPAFIETNRSNYAEYETGLSDIGGLRLLGYDREQKNNYQYVVVEYNEAVTGLPRDDLIRILWAENLIARRYFYPGCHRMEPYRSYYPQARLLLQNTEAVASRLLVLPTGTGIGTADIRRLCELIRWIVANAADVLARMKAAATQSSTLGSA